jgi:hypothetical protein
MEKIAKLLLTCILMIDTKDEVFKGRVCKGNCGYNSKVHPGLKEVHLYGQPGREGSGHGVRLVVTE